MQNISVQSQCSFLDHGRLLVVLAALNGSLLYTTTTETPERRTADLSSFNSKASDWSVDRLLSALAGAKSGSLYTEDTIARNRTFDDLDDTRT